MSPRALCKIAICLAVLAASPALCAPAPSANKQLIQPEGTAAYRALPDPRGCYVFPECGGYFLHSIDRPFRDLCTEELPFYAYVTGIFIRNKDGTLTQIYPSCKEPLHGSLEPDPDHEGFQIFVYLAYAG